MEIHVNLLFAIFIFAKMYYSASPSPLSTAVSQSWFIEGLKKQCSMFTSENGHLGGAGGSMAPPTATESREAASLNKYIKGEEVIQLSKFGNLISEAPSKDTNCAETSSGPVTVREWILNYAVEARRNRKEQNMFGKKNVYQVLEENKLSLKHYGKENWLRLSQNQKETLLNELSTVCHSITRDVNAERIYFENEISHSVDDIKFIKIEKNNQIIARRCCFCVKEYDTATWSDYGCLYVVKYDEGSYFLLTIEKLQSQEGPTLLLDYISEDEIQNVEGNIDEWVSNMVKMSKKTDVNNTSKVLVTSNTRVTDVSEMSKLSESLKMSKSTKPDVEWGGVVYTRIKLDLSTMKQETELIIPKAGKKFTKVDSIKNKLKRFGRALAISFASLMFSVLTLCETKKKNGKSYKK